MHFNSKIPNYLQDGLTFLPKIVFFGLLVGTVASNKGLGLIDITFSAISINAAASQLALMAPPEPFTIWGVMALTIGLNAKMLAYTASIWPHIYRGNSLKIFIVGAFTTDSSWACCQLAAQKGYLDENYAVKISLIFSSAWLIGCLAGFFFSAIMTQSMFSKLGLDALVPLSIALFVSNGLKSKLAKMPPVAWGVSVGLLIWCFSSSQTTDLLFGAAVAFAATFILEK